MPQKLKLNRQMGVYFVSGTDTGCGKTFITGLLARRATEAGLNVVTQKFVQTGCDGISEDIIAHRKIMGVDLFPEDKDGTTCNYVLKFPASAHLAARLEGVEIDLDKIAMSTKKLAEKYDEVFIEGAGGLMVPVSCDMLTIDYVARENLSVIFVAPSRLGSINHAILSVEACLSRGVKIAKFVYNDYPKQDATIADETRDYLRRYVLYRYPECDFFDAQ